MEVTFKELKNYGVKSKVLNDILRWENQNNNGVIRSTFNRELYLKILKLKQNAEAINQGTR
tara:strand:- start:6291 stop:6473 length:183 start_codon:yes stop_codon:yes gene_type:complete